MFECNYVVEGNNQIFKLNGKLDQDSYGKFDSFVNKNYSTDKNIILDLLELDYVSSVGLRSFIILAKKVKSNKHEINIKADANSMVYSLINLSGFSRLMPFIN
jgi:anti-sigma B factor antagonist